MLRWFRLLVLLGLVVALACDSAALTIKEGSQTFLLSGEAPPVVVTTSQTLGNAQIIDCRGGTAGITLTLPPAATAPLTRYKLIKGDNTLGPCRFTPTAGQRINGILNNIQEVERQFEYLEVTLLSTTTPDWHAVTGRIALDYGTDVVGSKLDETSYPLGQCLTTTPAHLWQTVAATTVSCLTGTNTQKAVVSFPDGATTVVQRLLRLPGAWNGLLYAQAVWLTPSITTTQRVVWHYAVACALDNQTHDPTYNATVTDMDDALATTMVLNEALVMQLPVTNCNPGSLAWLKVWRDAAHASDTLADVAYLLLVTVTIGTTLE